MPLSLEVFKAWAQADLDTSTKPAPSPLQQRNKRKTLRCRKNNSTHGAAAQRASLSRLTRWSRKNPVFCPPTKSISKILPFSFNSNRRGIFVTVNKSFSFFKPLKLARTTFAFFINIFRLQRLHKRAHNNIFLLFHSRGCNRNNHRGRIDVGNQPGKPVAFRVNQPIGVGLRIDDFSP